MPGSNTKKAQAKVWRLLCKKKSKFLITTNETPREVVEMTCSKIFQNLTSMFHSTIYLE